MGADDKCGVWVNLKCLKKFDHIKAVFFVGEEVGCVGSGKCDMAFFDDCRYVIQCDRRNGDDLITTIGGWTQLASQEFIQDIKPELFGYKEEQGLITDVGELKEKGLKVSAINLSCGYYEPHTDNEFTVKKDLINALRFAEHIIESCQGIYSHQPVERYGYGCYGTAFDLEFDELYNELWSILESNPDCSSQSVVRCYKEFYPHLKEADVEMVYDMVKTELDDYRRYSEEELGKI